MWGGGRVGGWPARHLLHAPLGLGVEDDSVNEQRDRLPGGTERIPAVRRLLPRTASAIGTSKSFWGAPSRIRQRPNDGPTTSAGSNSPGGASAATPTARTWVHAATRLHRKYLWGWDIVGGRLFRSDGHPPVRPRRDRIRPPHRQVDSDPWLYLPMNKRLTGLAARRTVQGSCWWGAERGSGGPERRRALERLRS